MKDSYAAIERVAKSLGYPTHWEDDVYVWDRQFIEKYNPSVFAWCIRRYGSHIMNIGPELEEPIMLDWAQAIAKTFEADDKRYYIWKEGTLVKCRSAETWLERIRRAERTRSHPTMRRFYAAKTAAA